MNKVKHSPYRIGLFDGIFSHHPQCAINLAGDNKGEKPKYIIWEKGKYLPITVFTDANLEDVLNAPPGIRKIAWLLEPKSLREDAYIKYENLKDHFDYMFTHIAHANCDEHKNHYWCPLGGAWVRRCEANPRKTKLVSMVTTNKKRAVGHQMRNELQPMMRDKKIDLYGQGSNPITSKVTALRDYRYSIVVESGSIPGYFTEKLIDAFLMQTVPIYWGDPLIHKYFDPNGIIICKNKEDILDALKIATPEWYKEREINIFRNWIRADFMRCAEDYAYLKYPWIFEEI